MGKRGPKARGEFTGQTDQINCRMSQACREAIEMSACESGRSLSQEMEALIWRGLGAGALPKKDVAAILRVLANELGGGK